MRTIVAGSREYSNFDAIRSILSRCPWSITEVVSGDARGPDKLGAMWAESRGIKVKLFPAEWNRQPDGSFDKGAGVKRNLKMAEYAKACIVFWDGKSSGSRNMIDEAINHGLHLLVVRI